MMRCPLVHQFNECLALQCDDYAGHQGPCHVTRDGQEFFVNQSYWQKPSVTVYQGPDKQGNHITITQPVRFPPIGCTNVQANSK